VYTIELPLPNTAKTTLLEDDRVMLPDQPPVVEGRIPSPEEMEEKAANGRHYLQDINVIKAEFPSHDDYSSRTNLSLLCENIRADVSMLGYTVVDSSHVLNNIVHCLELTLAWANIVREARTTQTMHILRRTPENCGAMLMIQRMEHLRGQCTEMAPVAVIALVRDDQLIVTRDRVADQATTERILIETARRPLNYRKPEESDECEVVEEVPPLKTNMPSALFKQQMRAIEDLLKTMPDQAALDGEQADVVEEVTDKLGAVSV